MKDITSNKGSVFVVGETGKLYPIKQGRGRKPRRYWERPQKRAKLKGSGERMEERQQNRQRRRMRLGSAPKGKTPEERALKIIDMLKAEVIEFLEEAGITEIDGKALRYHKKNELVQFALQKEEEIAEEKAKRKEAKAIKEEVEKEIAEENDLCDDLGDGKASGWDESMFEGEYTEDEETEDDSIGEGEGEGDDSEAED